MKKTNFILSFFALSNLVYCQQNLVMNPSFETFTTCPNNQSQVNYAVGWKEYNSADYFNICSMNPDFHVPKNWGGYQIPASGNAYCAVGNYITHSIGYNVREYIQGQLTGSLIVGTKYFASFKTCLSISSSIQVNCAIKNIGVLFTNASVSFLGPITANYSPQVNNTSFITDSLNWTQVFGSFIADSAYKFITLGNFYLDNMTDTLIMDGSNICSSYYYLDDICISTDSLFTKNYTFTNFKKTTSENINFRVYPNPTQGKLYLSNFDNLSSARLFDTFGNKLELIVSNNIIDINKLPNGVYILEIDEKNKSKYKLKIIKQ
ncbi:MAG: T9SS type A sorting domain-containing protein [Bacteroidota bacterium]|nr:T9SS type A sorting domain-containing protein [Bacteroidota bacterium]MCA6443842.1 T9SS type A sorting domain-containing protein [Bacteroidota bacterium]